MNKPVFSVDVTLDNFNQVVVEGSFTQPVLIAFWVQQSEACKTLTALLEQAVESYQGGLVLAKVDCNVEQQLAGQFGIQSLPTVIVFKEGQPVDGFAGSKTEVALKQWLEKYVEAPINNEELDKFEQAQALYQSGQLEEAELLLKDLLAADNSHMLALILYARCIAARGELEEAETVLSSVTGDDCKLALAAAKAQLVFLKQAKDLPSIEVLQAQLVTDPTNDELCYQLAIAQLAEQQYELAMAGLFVLFQRNRAFQDDLPRKTLVQLFELLGADHPLVIVYRKKLYQALY